LADYLLHPSTSFCLCPFPTSHLVSPTSTRSRCSRVHLSLTALTMLARRATATALRVSSRARVIGARSIAATADIGQAGVEADGDAKPFSAIPKPFLLPIVGSAFDFRTAGLDKGYKVQLERKKELGHIYFDKLFTLEGVYLSNVEDVQKVFSHEGRNPRRFPFQIWKDTRAEVGSVGGVFNLDGDDWRDARRNLAAKMLKPKEVRAYVPRFEAIAADLIAALERNAGEDGVVKGIDNLHFRWSLESIASVVFDTRIGCLEAQPRQEVDEFITGVLDFFSNSFKTLLEPAFFRQLGIGHYGGIVDAFRRIQKAGYYYIDKKLEEVQAMHASLPAESEADFVTYLISRKDVSKEEVVGSALEMLAGGVDTTSNTLMWTLYALADHPEKQARLKEEVEGVMKGGEGMTAAHLQNMPYLKACIKESQRLYPVANINSRRLDHDIVLSGYTVPKGTTLLLDTMSMGYDERYFTDPTQYKPERWLEGGEKRAGPVAFASLPFGFGPRMCVGRRVAEAEIQVALAKISRHFSGWESKDSTIEPAVTLLLGPERPLQLKFNK